MSWTGKDSAQLNKLEDYLKLLDIFENRNMYPNPGFTLAAIRNLSYVDVWRTHVKNHWYNIRLDDNSLLYFFKKGKELSYSFLGCPYECESFKEYKNNPEFIGLDEELLFESYEGYVTSSDLKLNPYYFRYDYEEGSYRQGEHPVAHLHCGLMENVRIGLIKGFDIMAFVAFILRQVYVSKWSLVLQDKKKFHELYICKSGLSEIDMQYYQEHDRERDFYLL